LFAFLVTKCASHCLFLPNICLRQAGAPKTQLESPDAVFPYQAPTYLPDLPAVRLLPGPGPGRVFYQECGFYQVPRIYQGGVWGAVRLRRLAGGLICYLLCSND
jgi:hypothetical protein